MSLEGAFRQYRNYFNAKIQEFGAAPRGVDYNGAEAQSLRFEQLVKIIDGSKAFELIDYGCGYGGLLGFLHERNWTFRYYGYDMLDKMVHAGRTAYADFPDAEFTAQEASLRPCDYLIAGAIFNNKFDAPVDQWRDHTLGVLQKMNALCTHGFSFNMLSAYSDADRMAERPDLYFADPLLYFDHCKRSFSRDVALLHDYGLYDFTILVRKKE
jgi:SAM-dependent methyltransferase